MSETCHTLWIPFGDGRAARVRIDVLSPVLPVPLEVEDSTVPTEADLDHVMHALANAEWQDAPPFEPGLEPVKTQDARLPKLWIHEGKGHYIGSLVIVAAASREDAEPLIREQLDKCGLIAEALEVTEVTVANGKPILTRSGDY